MKIINKKFIVLTTVIIVTLVPIMQSCNSNDDNINFKTSIDGRTKTIIESRTKTISESDIPKGITPLVVKDSAELYAIIKKLDILKIKFANSKKSNVRFKVPSESGNKNTTVDVGTDIFGGTWTILVSLGWSEYGTGSISVNSINSATWPNSSWTQVSGTASWNSGISYHITGCIIVYVRINDTPVEITRYAGLTVDGWINQSELEH